jgi:hypothetical protein
MEFKHPTGANNATSCCTTLAAFGLPQRGMLRFKIEGEYNNYIFSILQIFYKNDNAINITILETYTIIFKVVYLTCHIHLVFKRAL